MMKQNRSLKFWNFRIAILCLCAWYSFMLTSNAQWDMETKKNSQDSKADFKNMLPSPLTNSSVTNASVANIPPLEGSVDPDQYYVGPSDILSVNIWTSPQLIFPLTVTPEGTLIIPTVGEIHVAELTLSEVKKKVITEIKKKYLTGNPTVTLLNPRQIIVTVTGAVRYPGKYILYATDRIDNAITLANKKQKDVTPETKDIVIGKEIRKDETTRFDEENQTKRNIRLTRRTGERLRVDVLQYYATRDGSWNPFLREGDEIFIPRIDPKKNVFAVYGGVNVQGSFELVEGDNFLSAFELAYGFTSRAIKDSIILYRYNAEAGKQILSIYNFDQIHLDPQKNFALLPGDRIIVKEQPSIREDYHVLVDGEVRYPGIYPITRDSTTLSEVIGWAGGFTEYAALHAAEVVHSPQSMIEQKFDTLLSFRGGEISEDASYYAIENQLRLNHQAVSVDFVDLFAKKDMTQDIILQNGDWINIPSIQKSVYVFGQVVIPGNVTFMKGEKYKYYINKAGGYTDNARSGDVMVIKRGSRQWLSPSETKVEEGDYIWVPKESDKPFTYYLNIIGQTASIISVAVSIVLITIQLKK